jgi:hypothetical protein
MGEITLHVAQTVNTEQLQQCIPYGRGLFQVYNGKYRAYSAVEQWLRCCATNRKVGGSIPASVSGFFIHINFFRSYYGPGVDSASNRNEYQEHFLAVKAAGAQG